MLWVNRPFGLQTTEKPAPNAFAPKAGSQLKMGFRYDFHSYPRQLSAGGDAVKRR